MHPIRVHSKSVAVLCSAALIASLGRGPAAARPQAATTHAPAIGAVIGRFFTNPTDSGPFTIGPRTPVAFTQSFPAILFNPPPTPMCPAPRRSRQR